MFVLVLVKDFTVLSSLAFQICFPQSTGVYDGLGICFVDFGMVYQHSLFGSCTYIHTVCMDLFSFCRYICMYCMDHVMDLLGSCMHVLYGPCL